MTKFTNNVISEELLILAKTYPNPSMNYCETSCVAAINEQGELRRLYPIPFRHLEKDKQFKKWQWIHTKIEKSSDKRPESHNIDTLCLSTGETVPTDGNWSQRLRLIDHQIYPSFRKLEECRKEGICSMGFVRPSNVSFTLVKRNEPDWSEKELTYLQRQGLFDSNNQISRKLLKKVPYEFRYSFVDETENGPETYDFMITDWEISQFFWMCQNRYGNSWEEFFRKKMEIELPSKDLILMMGTMHRFQDQWLIIGIVYPPKRKPGEAIQPYLL